MKSNYQPLVSIVTPAYNGEKYLNDTSEGINFTDNVYIKLGFY